MLREPKPPRHLKSAGKKLWSDLVGEYSISDAAGLALVTLASECLDRLRGAQKLIDQHGAVAKDRYGGWKTHPAVGIEKSARDGMLSALRSLNLDLEPVRDAIGRPPAQKGT